MCGISGILSLDGHKSVDLRLLERMTEAVRHRGPDDAGYFCVQAGGGAQYAAKDSTDQVKELYPPLDRGQKASLGFGFRRLAILELGAGGHQPMSDLELGLHIVFNGEIYNHPELRLELLERGYDFASHSDTEVILKAYHAWGEDCVRRFNGIWAFALWDDTSKTLFCSRDRFGVKPFYYCVHARKLHFGSEIKQLLATGVDPSLNLPMLWRSMKINSLLVYGEETFWNGIKALEPGHNMSVKDGRIALKRYHRLDPASFEGSELSFDQAVERYRGLFQRAVRWQMRSDVEVGACLSGGLDSSAIVCTAAPLAEKPMRTFSSWFGDVPALDERKWINAVTLAAGTRSHLVSPSPEDAMAWFSEVTWFNDLPTGSGFAAQYGVMKLAQRQGIKVLLDGQGSDELTAGYRHAQYRYLADLIRSPKRGKLLSELGSYLRGKKVGERLGGLAKTLASAVMPESGLYEQEFRHLRFEPFNLEFTAKAKSALQGPALAKLEDLAGGRLSNFLYNMVYYTSLPTLLHFEDRMSMAAGIESRVPFLDHELAEFAFTLPSAYKVSPPRGKLIHRSAVGDIVPPAIRDRKDKAVFGSPFTQLWLRGELRGEVESLINSAEFRRRGIWDLPRIRENWQRYLRGDSKPAEMIFNIVALEIWFRGFENHIRIS